MSNNIYRIVKITRGNKQVHYEAQIYLGYDDVWETISGEEIHEKDAKLVIHRFKMNTVIKREVVYEEQRVP